MLGLELREEFRGRRLKGTAIELTNRNATGATQVAASEFLRITYPTTDLLHSLEATGPAYGRPVTLKGERGQGKSHLMAALYHAFTDNDSTRSWLQEWATVLHDPRIGELPLRSDMHVISESLHRQRYKYLWDLLFEQHPYGPYCQGKWEALGEKRTDVPSDEILLEMFQHTPTALILDEFQTWFDGLTNSRQQPRRSWAFNFIQILSEIAKEHPDILVLVVSVRNANSDAFQQIQRVNPVIVDFKGPSAKQDRLHLLLHRLFENRLQVADDKIDDCVAAHISEYVRLKEIAPAEHTRVREEFIQAWPYAPHLMLLLEDQVLMATHAQETRDLIRILADVYKRRGHESPIITAADFRLDDEESGIAALLDSVATQHHSKLREKALRNLESVRDAVANTGQAVPNLEGVVSALWLRSLTESNLAGADQATLQVDITKECPIDDNAFQVELANITENSFNIHEDGNRLIFREEENPQSKLIASARNDKLFQSGEGIERLTKEVRYVIGGAADVASKFRVVVLPQHWSSSPWEQTEDNDQPHRWDERIVLLVLPEAPDQLEPRLGQWLRENLQSKRNAVRFIVPRDGSQNLFSDRELVVLARAVSLAEKWKGQNPEYGRLQTKYQKELRDILSARFDRFALISNWNFQEPQHCKFYIESHRAEGPKIPQAVDKHVRENLFIPEEFQNLILSAAPDNVPVGKILNELREPRPNGDDCIPWLGETETKERIIRLCAQGLIAINVRGMEYLQAQEGESADTAWKRMRGRLGTGKHLDETYVLTPQAVASAGGVALTPEVGQEPTGIQPTGQTPVAPPSGGEIFQGGGFKPFTAPPTSPLNLLGATERWGITPGTQLQALRLCVDKLTGAQLSELLQKLPDGMTYEMELEKEES